MKWAKITIEATKLSADPACEILTASGCAGTVVDIDKQDKNLQHVCGYLPVDERLESRISFIKSKITDLISFGVDLYSNDIAIEEVDDDDWGLAWRKFFKPIRIGKVIIKPSWEDFESLPEDIIVNIDPAMAFGTGNHPTTRLCIQLLQDYIKGGETVFDVGTGSGILAMTAAKLGASTVHAIDIEPVAVNTAIKNIEDEQLQDKIICQVSNTPASLSGQADIVIANIIAVIISQMAPDLADKMKIGGILITSGIIDHMADSVKASLKNSGLKIIADHRIGDWMALVCTK